MPATPDSFVNDVSSWIKKAKENGRLFSGQLAVEIGARIVARTPRVTGNLVRSWYASINTVPAATEGANSNPVGQFSVIADQLQPGQRIIIGNVAPYARRVENGFVGTDSLGRSYNQQGRFFVRRTLEEAPQIANSVAIRLNSR